MPRAKSSRKKDDILNRFFRAHNPHDATGQDSSSERGTRGHRRSARSGDGLNIAQNAEPRVTETPNGTIKACPVCPNNKSHVADKYATFFQASIEEKVRVLVFERGSMPAYETQKSWYSYLLEYMELSDSQPIPERFPWTRAFAKVRSRTIVPLQRAFNRNRDRSQLPSDDATRDWAAVVALHAWAGTHIHRDDPTTLRRGRAEKSEEANATSETLAIENPEDTKEEVRRLRQRLSVVEDQLAALQTQVRDLQGPEPSQAPGLWQNPRKRFAKGPTLWEKPEKQARRE